MTKKAFPSASLISDEGVEYVPFITSEKGGRLEVGIIVVLPDGGGRHEVTLIPSTSTGEGDGTGNVFFYEDDDPIVHVAWAPENTNNDEEN